MLSNALHTYAQPQVIFTCSGRTGRGFVHLRACDEEAYSTYTRTPAHVKLRKSVQGILEIGEDGSIVMGA